MKIDGRGRIALPKSVRDRLGFNPGSELDLEGSADSITLKPVPGVVLDENGQLVFTGKPMCGIDWVRLVEYGREERIREIGGW